jgi:hypothetical protein
MRSWLGRLLRPALRRGTPSILTGGRSLDVGPVPINWPDVSSETPQAVTQKIQVTSINVPIVMSATRSGTSMLVNVYVNGNTSNDGAVVTTIQSTVTRFTVPPNCYVWFVGEEVIAPASTNVRVRNVTDGNSVVDQFNLYTSVVPPP